MNSVSRKLAEVLSSTSFNALPKQAVTDAHRAVLDWLGSALAGASEPPARMTQTIVAGLGRSDDATVFGAGRSSAAGAALANGVSSHMLELDDLHKGSTLHPAAPIIPAALAVAEREHADGHAFLLAVTLGYEAALRIGEAVNPSHYKFWHPTGTAATFGAAVAAGSLLKLNAGEMLHALGSAGTQAAGLWEFNADGTMSKHLHPGKAAMNGVLAADLASVGFTGASKILEGARGFFRSQSTSFDETRITDRLGELWKITENCYKVWGCCGHTHSAIDVAGDIRNQQGWTGKAAADKVASIHIETYGPGFEIVKTMNPATPFQAKFSIAYCVAASLLFGGAPPDAFAPEHFAVDGVRDPAIAALLKVTKVTVADDLNAQYPAAWPTRLHVKMKDGSIVHGASNYPVGNPENPVSTTQLEDKFVSMVAPRCGADVASRALDALHAIETCGDMSEPLRDLVPEHATAGR